MLRACSLKGTVRAARSSSSASTRALAWASSGPHHTTPSDARRRTSSPRSSLLLRSPASDAGLVLGSLLRRTGPGGRSRFGVRGSLLFVPARPVQCGCSSMQRPLGAGLRPAHARLGGMLLIVLRVNAIHLKKFLRASGRLGKKLAARGTQRLRSAGSAATRLAAWLSRLAAIGVGRGQAVPAVNGRPTAAAILLSTGPRSLRRPKRANPGGGTQGAQAVPLEFQ